MNPPTRTKTGFGLFDTRHAIARRIARERDRAENPPRDPARINPTIMLPPQPWQPTERRPLAA